MLGGGPAGAATALELARRGRDVVLLEATRFDGPRVGETLPPEANPLLRRLGVWDAFLASRPLASPGTVSAWGSPRPAETDFVANPHGNGWHVDRNRFDRMLCAAAATPAPTSARAPRAALHAQRGPTWTVTTAARSGASGRPGAGAPVRRRRDGPQRSAPRPARRPRRRRRADRGLPALRARRRRRGRPTCEPSSKARRTAGGTPPRCRPARASPSSPSNPTSTSRRASCWRATRARTAHLRARRPSAARRLAHRARLVLAPPRRGGTRLGGRRRRRGLVRPALRLRHRQRPPGRARARRSAGVERLGRLRRRATADGSKPTPRQRRAYYALERRWTDRPFWRSRALDSTRSTSRW